MNGLNIVMDRNTITHAYNNSCFIPLPKHETSGYHPSMGPHGVNPLQQTWGDLAKDFSFYGVGAGKKIKVWGDLYSLGVFITFRIFC